MTQTTDRQWATTGGRPALVRANVSRSLPRPLTDADAAVLRALAPHQRRADMDCMDNWCRAFATGDDQ